jgi:hypothetical protein
MNADSGECYIRICSTHSAWTKELQVPPLITPPKADATVIQLQVKHSGFQTWDKHVIENYFQSFQGGATSLLEHYNMVKTGAQRSKHSTVQGFGAG